MIQSAGGRGGLMEILMLNRSNWTRQKKVTKKKKEEGEGEKEEEEEEGEEEEKDRHWKWKDY